MLDMYGGIFRVYDRLNADIDYDAWANFVEEIFSKYSKREVKSVLDLACGTGSMTLQLAKIGYDLTGVDLSPDRKSVV